MSTGQLKAQGGIILIEVLVASLIFAGGILAVIGLQASTIAGVADSKFRVDASTVANRILGVMWANQTGLAAGTTTSTVTELPNGTSTATLTVLKDPLDATVTVGYAASVLVEWQPPNTKSADKHKFSTVANIYTQ